ncbi:hypothetical protein [Rubritalea tangerina]|uniref:hypothetical protein n=1 Tax=Rubritalea tangerina TaxID=430798 RepID=UPI00361B2715
MSLPATMARPHLSSHSIFFMPSHHYRPLLPKKYAGPSQGLRNFFPPKTIPE